MRWLAVLVLLAVCGVGCKRRQHPNPAATIEEEAELSPTVNVFDGRDSSQLLNGFHALESGGFRWTMKAFAVTLAAPPIRGRAARLEMTLTLPEVVATQMAGVTLSAKLGDKPLGSRRIEKAGEQTIRFDVPAEALGQEQAFIARFELDKAVGPTASDSRQLGLIVSRIGLVAQ